MLSKPSYTRCLMVCVYGLCQLVLLRSGSLGSSGVDGPGEGARLLRVDAHGDCGQRAVAELALVPSSAHRIERTGETSRELSALPRSDMIRKCRGSLSWVDGVDAPRPLNSSSAMPIEEGETSETGEFCESCASVDEPEGGVEVVDKPIALCNGREW
jgi:hypothetical protein